MKHTLWIWMDRLMASALLGALAMALATAWPGHAQAETTVRGQGAAATETRSLAEFEAIRTESVDVLVRQGASQQVQVQADQNLLPLIEATVEDGRQGKTLVLRWKRGTSIYTRSKPLVTVTLVRVNALIVDGSGDVRAEALKTPKLLVQVTGSGDVRLTDLQADALAISVTGSGDVVASGQAPKLDIKVRGSGDVNTDALRADEVQVSIAGSGDARVQAQRTLAISIAGSGDVLYSGAATVSQSVAGSGTVSRR